LTKEVFWLSDNVKQGKRWYDKKDPVKRSIFERIFYKLVAKVILNKLVKFESNNQISCYGMENLENVLKQHQDFNFSIVVVANHIHDYDTTLLPAFIHRKGYFSYKIAKLELFEGFFEKLKMYWVGARPIDRDAMTRDVWIITRLIEARQILITFPTGHRDPENTTPINVGIFSATRHYKDSTIILPVKITGTHMLKKGGCASFTFKKPICVSQVLAGKDGISQLMQQVALEIGVPMPERKRKSREERERVEI